MDQQQWLERIEGELSQTYHVRLKEASATQLHQAIGHAAMGELTGKWLQTQQSRKGKRRACYLSAEYLVGRMVYNNLFCLDALSTVKEALCDKGVDIALMEDVEDDAFGNGGLGRLAACFLDSAATLDVPLDGYGLRYRFGLFRQSFEDCRQYEEPDDWARYGDPWSIRREEQSVVVPMKTGSVRAVPYDMPIIGYKGRSIGTLRLWQTESLNEIDFPLFNAQKYAAASSEKNKAEDIVKFLYPNDTTREGKLLRVKQQYVLCSASLQDMLRVYRKEHGSDYSMLAKLYAVQLNDTHPVMSIPELIRLLGLDGVSFDAAFDIAKEMFSYTNHTVMQEALEKWDMPLIHAVSPEISAIIRKIDKRFRADMKRLGVTPTIDRCILWENRVHMAQLAVYGTHTTNGVAKLHSELLKKTIFSKWYELYPDRFQNKTNGVTQRRWLGLCNPELCQMLDQVIGKGYLSELTRLSALENEINPSLAMRFHEIKQLKKRQLAAIIEKREGVRLSADMVFDVQVKRLHEYKRQLMNALAIVAVYQQLKDGTLKDFTPTAFIFGAKAAPGYVTAKTIIRYINQIAQLINSDPDMENRMRVVFVQNYDVSYAEHIIPAADISEQISPAGTEASGTGNMKLMMNGAVTLGTFDGANVEIVEQAGLENNYIFGETVESLALKKPNYVAREIYESHPVLRRALSTLIDGTFKDEDGALEALYHDLLDGASWHQPDHQFVLLDFDSYLKAKLEAIRDYRDTVAFSSACLRNIANSGVFSSDRTIAQYAKEIWRV